MRSDSSPSAFAGGVAAKWGNRYEAWWTIWRGVLPVLRGAFEALEVERPDLAGEAAEFRLYGQTPDGTDEVHQCKRQRATSWTVRALDTEGVLQPFGEHLASGTRAVFVSATPSILRTLAEKARPLSTEKWSANLNQDERTARDELVHAWNLDERGVHDRLTRLTVHIIDDMSLRDIVVESLAAALHGDPESALFLLAGFVIDHLMEPLTASQMWDFLRSKGYPPRSGFDLALSERVRELTSRYVAGVQGTRPHQLPLLPRAEADHVVAALSATDGPDIVAVTGPPGGGKSTVIAAACSRLVNLRVVVGALRLDLASEAPTADSLGGQEAIGFGGPPARVLRRATAGGPAVLVIDQLDALSALSGRGDTVLEGVRQTLQQAGAIPNVRVLVACRRYDLTHDRRLRELLQVAHAAQAIEPGEARPTDLLEVTVGDLSPDQVRDAVGELGLSTEGIRPRLARLLANAFNLSLFAGVVEDARDRDELGSFDPVSLRTQQDLLAEYHLRLGRRLQPTLGIDGYANAVFRIARLLGDSGQLSAPSARLSDLSGTVDVLTHEGVLVAEGARLRFFHEAYLDHVFALQHVQSGRTISDLLQDDPQDLPRQGQVRAILSLEREQDERTYTLDLRAVLDQQSVRSHLRAAVLTWLTDLSVICDQELELVLEIAASQQAGLRAIRTLSSEPFVRALNNRVLLPIAAAVIAGAGPVPTDGLAGQLARLDAQGIAYLLFEAARCLPEEASAASLPLASDPVTATRWVWSLLRTVFLAGPDAGRATVRLFCVLAETLTGYALGAWTGQAADNVATPPTPNKENPPSVDGAVRALFGDDGKHALHTLAQHTPAHAVKAIRTWLRAGAKLATARGAWFAFDGTGPLPDKPGGLETFARCATAAPAEFAEAIAPFLVEQVEHAARDRSRWRPAGEPQDSRQGLRYDLIWPPGNDGALSLGEEIHSAVRTALQLAAAQHPQQAKPVIDQLVATDLFTAQQLAAAAYTSCAAPLLDDALAWAAVPRVRGLPARDLDGWAWGSVLAHVAATGSAEQREAAVQLVLDPYAKLDLGIVSAGSDQASLDNLPPEQQEHIHLARSVAAEQLVAMSQVSRELGESAPKAVLDRQSRLEALLGAAAPAEPVSSSTAGRVGSPVTDEVARNLTDEQWLEVIRTYAADRTAHQDGQVVGGAYEVAWQSEAATKEEPRRFARLIERIGPDANPAYVTAILRGLTAPVQALASEDERAALDAARTVFSWSPRLFNSHLCRLVSSLARHDLPDDILNMIRSIATTARPPRQDAGSQDGDDIIAEETPDERARAVITMADLLSPAATRTHRATLLLPALEAVLDDPAEPVRAMLPAAIVRTYPADRAAAIKLATRWIHLTTDDGLRAPDIDQLAWQLVISHPSSGVLLIRRMLIASHEDVRTKGGQLAAQVAVRKHQIDSDSRLVQSQSLLSTALANSAARAGVAMLLAQLIDELADRSDTTDETTSTVHADRHLLLRLLDDSDQDVRAAAVDFGRYLTQPLNQYTDLLKATATSRAFREHPGTLLHALRAHAGNLPAEALELCENWLIHHAGTAGDIRTAAAADAYYVTDIVLSIHARSAIGSTERERCLNLLDRLIDAGAADANTEADYAI